MNILQRAAESVLFSDRAKADEYGGQKFTSVRSVEVSGGEDSPAYVTLTSNDGVDTTSVVNPHRVFRPEKRAMAPADVCDAVEDAMLDALEKFNQN